MEDQAVFGVVPVRVAFKACVSGEVELRAQRFSAGSGDQIVHMLQRGAGQRSFR